MNILMTYFDPMMLVVMVMRLLTWKMKLLLTWKMKLLLTWKMKLLLTWKMKVLTWKTLMKQSKQHHE